MIKSNKDREVRLILGIILLLIGVTGIGMSGFGMVGYGGMMGYSYGGFGIFFWIFISIAIFILGIYLITEGIKK